MMQVDLQGKTAIVTGGGTGIGRAIALGFGRCGANVVVDHPNGRKEADEVVKEIRGYGSKAIEVRADVTRWDEVQAMFSATLDAFGRVDILVNNAGGITTRHPAHEVPEEVWSHIVELNATSVFLCCKAAIPLLPDGTGRIINISSVAAHNGASIGLLPYGAAKAAVHNMTRNLAKELAPRGITVNGIAPGIIDTDFHRLHTPPETYAAFVKQIPLGRDGKPEDLVGAALLLASPEGSYITGEIIEVNGGAWFA
jgi:3-oxoacyl-[acyl-carrier protein] reductase